MSTGKKITAIVVVLSVVLLGGYDVFAVLKYGIEGTISHLIYTESFNYPAIPFFMGCLMGHFFL